MLLPSSRPAWVDRGLQFFSREVWAVDLDTLPALSRWLYRSARVAYLAVRNFIGDGCTFRASGLTYATLLSLVPSLAFVFAVAKGLGALDAVREQTLEPFLDSTFGSLGESEHEDLGFILRDEEEVGEEQEAPTVDEVPGPIGVVPDDSSSGEEQAQDSGPGIKLFEADDQPDLKPEAEETGKQLRRIFAQVLDFVEKTEVSGLGVTGLIVVLWTLIKVIGTVERTFNEIWRIKRSRTLVRKLTDYLSMVVIVPIFLAIATGISTSVKEWYGSWTLGSGWLATPLKVLLVFGSLGSLWLGFSFLYSVLPNRRVPLTSAVLGGMVGGTLWRVTQFLHVEFQVGMANYNVLYAGFAAIPIFMLWVYLSWISVLFGAEVAAAHQNAPMHQQKARAIDHDNDFKELLGVRALVAIAQRFERAEKPATLGQLGAALSVPEQTLVDTLERLRGRGIIVAAEDGFEEGVLLARDPRQVHVSDILDAVRGRTGRYLRSEQAAELESIPQVLAELEDERVESSRNVTLQWLVEREATA